MDQHRETKQPRGTLLLQTDRNFIHLPERTNHNYAQSNNDCGFRYRGKLEIIRVRRTSQQRLFKVRLTIIFNSFYLKVASGVWKY